MADLIQLFESVYYGNNESIALKHAEDICSVKKWKILFDENSDLDADVDYVLTLLSTLCRVVSCPTGKDASASRTDGQKRRNGECPES